MCTWRPFTSARKPTPRMSSLRSQPLATPLAALAKMERASPCRLRASRLSSGRATSTWPSLNWTVTPGGSVTSTLPFGPSKCTDRPASAALTFPSNLIGSLPMRLMSVHRADEFAAHVLLAGVAVCQDALRGGEDAGAQTAEDPRNVPHRDVAAESGTAHPPDADDDRALVRSVLELDGDLALRPSGLVLGEV